jgi:hypothetical protein
MGLYIRKSKSAKKRANRRRRAAAARKAEARRLDLEKKAAARRDQPSPKGYWARNQILVGLGYDNYRDYLRSSCWRKIRASFLKNISRCMICYKLGVDEVHHEFYSVENLEGHSIDGLVAVCKTCHHYIEFRHDGTKTDLDEAHQRLIGRLRRLL